MFEENKNNNKSNNKRNDLSVERPPYFVPAAPGMGEIVEKKSRFIATVAPVQTEAEAHELTDSVKKKYWDARHNCSAYIIGNRSELTRYSDDGEPQGTAGRPMLEVLQGAGLTYTAAVVTRYFGGTLLGAGGLVRAYTQAVQEGLRNTPIVRMCYGSALTVCLDYPDMGRLKYLLEQMGLAVSASRYEARVELDLMVPFAETEAILRAVTEATMGRAETRITGGGYYPAG